MTTEHTLVRGAQVVTSDGHEIGVVGEMIGDAFQVEGEHKAGVLAAVELCCCG